MRFPALGSKVSIRQYKRTLTVVHGVGTKIATRFGIRRDIVPRRATSAGTVLTPGPLQLLDVRLEEIGRRCPEARPAMAGPLCFRDPHILPLAGRSKSMRSCSHRCSLVIPVEYRLPARSTGQTTDGCCAVREAAPGFARRPARSFKNAVSTRLPSAPSPRAQEWGRVRSTAM